jgi:hypothetical protein
MSLFQQIKLCKKNENPANVQKVLLFDTFSRFETESSLTLLCCRELVNRMVKSYDSSLMARSNASRKNGMIVRRSSAVRASATCETRLLPCAILMKCGALALRPR